MVACDGIGVDLMIQAVPFKFYIPIFLAVQLVEYGTELCKHLCSSTIYLK